MKPTLATLLSLSLSLLLFISISLSAQTTGQNSIEKKATTGNTKESFTLSPSQIIGRVANGTLGGVTLGSGLTLTGNTLSVSVTASALGLGNVDNTSDLAKPISTATQTALDGKLNTAAAAAFQPRTTNLDNLSAVSSSAFGRSFLTQTDATSTRITLSLNNVTNTSDAEKPISTATQTALNAKENTQTAATQAEMEAGSQATIRSVSPLRVKQAIDARLTVNSAGFARIVAADGSVHHVAVTAGEPPLLTVLTGQTANLATAISAARRTVPNYTGALIRVLNTTTSVQTDIPQTATGELNETALLAARTSGQALVIHTFYDQDGSGDHLVVADVAKPLRIVSSDGVIDRMGRQPAGVAVDAYHGLYKTSTFTAHTGTTASGYVVATMADNPAMFNSYIYGVANGTGTLFGSDASASFFGRREKTVEGIASRNSTNNVIPGNRSFWDNERITAITRFTGSQARSDTGYPPGVSSSTANFNFNNIVVGGYNNGVASQWMAAGSKFAEMAVWRADIGESAGVSIQRNASGAYAAANSKWNGKKIIWVGTSMPVTVTGASNLNPYPQRLADAIGAWIVNVGTGSSRITYSASYNLTLSATAAEQTANGFSSSVHESFQTKILGGTGSPDYLVIDHCLNDYLQTHGAITSTNKGEYCGALNFIRTQTLAAYPNCKIIVLTPITNRAAGGAIVSPVNAIAQTLRNWAAQYPADVALVDPLAGLAWGAPEATLYTPDGTHLNAAGAAVVATWLTTAFNSITL
jgi:lysophospholipase L1-like esterase